MHLATHHPEPSTFGDPSPWAKCIWRPITLSQMHLATHHPETKPQPRYPFSNISSWRLMISELKDFFSAARTYTHRQQQSCKSIWASSSSCASFCRVCWTIENLKGLDWNKTAKSQQQLSFALEDASLLALRAKSWMQNGVTMGNIYLENTTWKPTDTLTKNFGPGLCGTGGPQDCCLFCCLQDVFVERLVLVPPRFTSRRNSRNPKVILQAFQSQTCQVKRST